MALLIVAIAGCSSRHTASTAAPAASPAPLRACETRELTVDGADVVVTSNADASLASVHVVSATEPAAGNKATAAMHRFFGPIRHDTRIFAHQSRWWAGLPTYSDACGHPVTPVTAAPTVSP